MLCKSQKILLRYIFSFDDEFQYCNVNFDEINNKEDCDFVGGAFEDNKCLYVKSCWEITDRDECKKKTKCEYDDNMGFCNEKYDDVLLPTTGEPIDPNENLQSVYDPTLNFNGTPNPLTNYKEYIETLKKCSEMTEQECENNYHCDLNRDTGKCEDGCFLYKDAKQCNESAKCSFNDKFQECEKDCDKLTNQYECLDYGCMFDNGKCSTNCESETNCEIPTSESENETNQKCIPTGLNTTDFGKCTFNCENITSVKHVKMIINVLI